MPGAACHQLQVNYQEKQGLARWHSLRAGVRGEGQHDRSLSLFPSPTYFCPPPPLLLHHPSTASISSPNTRLSVHLESRLPALSPLPSNRHPNGLNGLSNTIRDKCSFGLNGVRYSGCGRLSSQGSTLPSPPLVPLSALYNPET